MTLRPVGRVDWQLKPGRDLTHEAALQKHLRNSFIAF
jgi:hypothetical protein